MQKIHFLIGLGLLGMSTASLAAEHQGRGQQALENLDSNGDGFVDFTEFQENGPDVLANMDTDGDNAISLDEFLDARPSGRRGARGGSGDGRGPDLSDEELAEIQEMMLERATERFNSMDLDGNGLVSAIEFQEANFLQMDDDGDGLLSAAELRRRGPGGPGRRGPGQRGSGRGPHTDDT